jgi:hypothetical protein
MGRMSSSPAIMTWPRPTRPEASRLSKTSTVKKMPDCARIRRSSAAMAGVTPELRQFRGAQHQQPLCAMDAPRESTSTIGTSSNRRAAASAEPNVPDSAELRMTASTVSPSSAAALYASRNAFGGGCDVVGRSPARSRSTNRGCVDVDAVPQRLVLEHHQQRHHVDAVRPDDLLRQVARAVRHDADGPARQLDVPRRRPLHRAVLHRHVLRLVRHQRAQRAQVGEHRLRIVRVDVDLQHVGAADDDERVARSRSHARTGSASGRAPPRTSASVQKR